VLDPRAPVNGLADSKKLTAKRRDELAYEIREHALAWSVAWADPAEIDAINILAATMLAMRRAILGLVVMPNRVLIDGNRLPDLRFEQMTIAGEAIIGGDDLIPAISAASIVAKTTRDRMMVALDKIYPRYEFARHKGYGTDVHREKLREFGPCCEHRRTFAPVRAAS
jgi:ribonuclease HII